LRASSRPIRRSSINPGGIMAATSTWQLDATHSAVEFSVKHMMITTVRGRFKEVRGTVTADEANPDASMAQVEIDVASIDTGVADRDAHLRSPDFFDAESYPTITFRSKRVDGCIDTEGCKFKMVGDLTIRDTTMEIELDCVFEGRGKDPWGGERAGFGATGEIDRRDWGLKWNQTIETGGVLVANRVKIDIDVQFVRQSAQQAA
jgi:polyisoprenoid-binding protein YceI